MTIKEYFKIHSKETAQIPIRIMPISLFGKDYYEKQTIISTLYDKIKTYQFHKNSSNPAYLNHEMWFYNVQKMANVVDFNTKIKKAHIGYESCYSFDADINIYLYIDDDVFIKMLSVYAKQIMI